MASHQIRRRSVVIAVTFVILHTLPAAAQLTSSVYVSGLSQPVAFIQDPSNASVQYVVEQGGRIRVVVNGALQGTDFLDLSTAITTGGERGLLGLAFAPDYASSRRFFVNFTDPAGNTVIARFLRSAANPLVADASTRFDLRWPGGQRFIVQPFPNHNGGNLVFGPDGYLYIGMGDGGGANDPDHLAQNPSSLLGKMLRINVNVADSDAEGYDVPADNPFLDGAPVAALGEIWSFGLRNPWRFSFDDPARGGSGAMFIGDVGQATLEEVSYEPPGRGGRNYGWRNREGNVDNVTTEEPAYLPLIDPILVFDRTNARSITGGFVYRGTQLGTAYRGRYFVADFITSRVWSVAIAVNSLTGEATASDLREHTAELGGTAALGNVSSFGVDASGELYLVSYGLGRVVRINATAPPPVSTPQMHIDLPAEGSTVAPPFAVAGWALDLGAASGVGIDAVHVYAYPVTGAPPIFLGAAALGFARPDVAAIFGPSFQASGFALTVGNLAQGGYLLVVYGRSTVSGAFSIARTRPIVVQSGVRMVIDVPAAARTIGQPAALAGWAIDVGAPTGTGVDAIHVYAYPGSGSPPIFLGVARYGDARPDVGQFFGARFTNSGFSLSIAGLAPGPYLLVAFARSTVSGTFEARWVSITVAGGEQMALDAPGPGAIVGSSFPVAGWAFDAVASSGTGVDVVHVWAYPANATPVFLGSATYGIARPDVGGFFGARFQNSGYALNATGLGPGDYTLVVYARSTVTGSFSNAVARAIRVP